MSTDAICTCSHGLGVLRHADDCPVAIERRQPVRLAALSAPSEPPAKIAELRAELESANERIKELLGQRDKAGHLVADLVRADNNRTGSGPGGRINAGDTIPLQLLLGLSLTIRDMFEGTQFEAPAAPSEPVPDGPRVWAAAPTFPDDVEAFRDAEGRVWRRDPTKPGWRRDTGAWTEKDPLELLRYHPRLAPLTEVVEEATP